MNNVTQLDSRHKILAEIHTLLSHASSEDLVAASKLCKSPNIRQALLLLSSEIEPISQNIEQTRKNTKSATNAADIVSSSGSVDMMAERVKHISVILEKSPLLATRPMAVKFIINADLGLPKDEKASRKRIIWNAARQLAQMTNQGRTVRILKDALGEGDEKMAGWMNVIRRS